MRTSLLLLSALICAGMSYGQKAKHSPPYYNGQAINNSVDRIPEFKGDLAVYLLTKISRIKLPDYFEVAYCFSLLSIPMGMPAGCKL